MKNQRVRSLGKVLILFTFLVAVASAIIFASTYSNDENTYIESAYNSDVFYEEYQMPSYFEDETGDDYSYMNDYPFQHEDIDGYYAWGENVQGSYYYDGEAYYLESYDSWNHDYIRYYESAEHNNGYIGIVPFGIPIPVPWRFTRALRPIEFHPTGTINLYAGVDVRKVIDFWPGYSLINYTSQLSIQNAPTMHVHLAPNDLTTTASRISNPLQEYYHVVLRAHAGSVNPHISGEVLVNFHAIQVGMEPVLDLNIQRAVVGEYIPNIHDLHWRPVAIQNLRPQAPIAPLELEIQPGDSGQRYFSFIVGTTPPPALSPALPPATHNIVTDFIATAVNPATSGPPATINNLPFQVIPDPNLDLGPGLYSNMVLLWQDAYIHSTGQIERAYLNDPWWAPGQPGTLAANAANPLREHRGEFEVRFEVMRPATAVNIITPEGPNRDAGVYVNHHYRHDPDEQLSYYYQCDENHVCDPDHYLDFLGSTPIYHPNYRDIQMIIPPPRYTFFDYEVIDSIRRPVVRTRVYDDPYCDDCCIHDPTIITTPLQITPPNGYAIVDATVNDDGNLVVRLRPLHTVTFHLRGGHIVSAQTDAVVRINRLQGCEIQLGEGNATTGHAVTAYPFFDGAAMPQRGVPQPNPTRQNSVFHGWREITATGEIIGTGPILSSQDVAFMRVTGNRHFEAVYTLHLVFYKVDMDIYNDPFNIVTDRNPLSGAVFQLRDYADTETLYPPTPPPTPTPTGTDGRVVIGGGPTPPPGLILPSGPVPETVQFRLVETTAPDDHVLPTGHWVVTINVVTGELVSTTPYVSHGGNPDFIWRPLPGASGASASDNYSYLNYHYGEYEQYYYSYYESYIGGYIGYAPTYEPYYSFHHHHGHNRYEYSNYYGYMGTAPSYISIVPYGPEVEHATVTHPSQLQAAITSVPTNGVPHIIRLDFPANVVSTVDTPGVSTINVPTIQILGNRNIILDSATGVNQVWNRNQYSGRHIQVNGTLELRNVTLSRSAAWVATAPSSALSGGVNVSGVFRMNHPNATISNNAGNPGGGVFVGQRAYFYMYEGNIINNRSPGTGGGVSLDGVWESSVFTMTGGRISNNTAIHGGGIGMCCAVTVNIGGTAQIYGNTATYGGGINMGGGPDYNSVTMSGGSVHANHATVNGGGIHRGIDDSPYIMPLTINNGTITLNTAGARGGGIYVPVGGNGIVTINGGYITRNHAGLYGGGLYIHHNNNQIIPDFTIGSGVTFRQNVAGNGMRVSHAMNTQNTLVNPGGVTVIPTAHAFTNHDINANGPAYGWHVGNREDVDEPDWIRLNHAINHLVPAPTTIIIHQAGAPNMSFSEDHHDIPGATFHLVVTDPAPGVHSGRTITTVPIPFAVGFPTDPHHFHRINVTRPVTVRAADGANIYLRMPFYGSHTINSAHGAPWEITVNNAFNRDLGRHFIVPSGISFTLGGAGTGTLSLDGNVAAQTAHPNARRGGIRVDGGTLTMTTGSRITNSRNVSFWSVNQGLPGSGGAVQALNGANFAMTGNAVIENSEANTHAHFHEGPTPPGNLYVRGQTAHGGGVYVNDSTFNMSGSAVIRNNSIRASREGTAVALNPHPYLSFYGEGGGVHITNDSTFNMSGSAEISENTVHQPVTTGFYGITSIVMFGGGGVAVWHGSTFNMSGDAMIRDNNAMSPGMFAGVHMRGEGGGVIMRHHDSIFNMNGGYIQDNEATYGGGVAVEGYFTTTGGTPTFFPAGTFTMTNGTIRNNTARSNGGGVHVNLHNSRFIMHDGTISGNRATHGRGVAVATGARFDMHDGVIYRNRYNASNVIGTIGFGGGVSVMGVHETNRSTFNMHGGTIGSTNLLFANQALSGGGVHVGTGGWLYMNNDALIVGNLANNGGGVTVTGVSAGAGSMPSVFNFQSGRILNNIANESGGGVNITSQGRAFMMVEEAEITAQLASGLSVELQSYIDYYIGDAPYMVGYYDYLNSAPFEMALLDFAALSLQAQEAYATINASGANGVAMISGNNSLGTGATQGGGGVFLTVQAATLFRMDGGIIGGDTAALGNTSANHGGGVFVSGSARFEMRPGEDTGGDPIYGRIIGNTAAQNGGGVYVFSLLPLPGSPPSTFIMSAGVIGGDADDGEGNTAVNGGGVHVAGGALFEMRADIDANNDPTRGTISGNTATGTTSTWPDASGGGGVHVVGANSSFNMYAGLIDSNEAAHGGGVLVRDNANFNLRGTGNKTITRNSATWGGGVWTAWVYGSASPDTSHMTMATGANNLHITHNTAAQRGGGIFTMAAEYADPLTRTSGTNIAYGNLTLNSVNFSNNRASHREFSPANALDVLPNTLWNTISADIHPINNYDINFIGRGFELPLTGGLGSPSMIMLTIIGTMLLVGAILGAVVIKNRRGRLAYATNNYVTRGSLGDGRDTNPMRAKTHFNKVRRHPLSMFWRK